jgi:hypothetical protein
MPLPSAFHICHILQLNHAVSGQPTTCFCAPCISIPPTTLKRFNNLSPPEHHKTQSHSVNRLRASLPFIELLAAHQSTSERTGRKLKLQNGDARRPPRPFSCKRVKHTWRANKRAYLFERKSSLVTDGLANLRSNKRLKRLQHQFAAQETKGWKRSKK